TQSRRKSGAGQGSRFIGGRPCRSQSAAGTVCTPATAGACMAEVIAVGASQGGVQALKTLVAGLAKKFETPILVVLHIGAERSILPAMLNDPNGLRASHAVEGEAVRPGHIHIAPPDHHMTVADGHIRLSRGPRENWARPAIDPLFRS